MYRSLAFESADSDTASCSARASGLSALAVAFSADAGRGDVCGRTAKRRRGRRGYSSERLVSSPAATAENPPESSTMHWKPCAENVPKQQSGNETKDSGGVRNTNCIVDP